MQDCRVISIRGAASGKRTPVLRSSRNLSPMSKSIDKGRRRNIPARERMIQEIESFVDPHPRRGSNSILHLACRDTLRCLSSPASLDLFLPFSPVILPPSFLSFFLSFFFSLLRLRLLPFARSLTHLPDGNKRNNATRENERVGRRARAEAKGWKERRGKRKKAASS